MADEDTILEEAMDNLKGAGQRIRATQSLMRSEGMTNCETREEALASRVTTAFRWAHASWDNAESGVPRSS